MGDFGTNTRGNALAPGASKKQQQPFKQIIQW